MIPARWWLWPSLLSLDAPLVALAWQDLLFRCYPTVFGPAGRWTLGLTVWIIYLLDRLLDTRLPMPGKEDRLPHDFYRRHRRTAAILLVAAVAADLWLSLFVLRSQVLTNGLWLSIAVLAYFYLFPWSQLEPLAKPVSAALIFTAGVFLVGWTGTASPAHTLTWPALAFCGLCLGNLLLVGRWEEQRATRSLCIPLAVLALICAARAESPWYFAAAASAAGLAALAMRGKKVPDDVRRVLADAVLLTPILRLWIPIR